MTTSRLNFLVTFIGFLDTHLLIPVIALFAAALGSGVGTIGLVIGIYSMTNTVSNIVGGRLVDRFGYKKPLIGGLLGDAVAMFGYTLCQVPWQLGLVRAFHGSTGGLVGPATMSAMASRTTFRNRGRIMGMYGAAIALATLIGYGGGGLVASRWGYEFVFYTGGFLLLISIILTAFMPGNIKAADSTFSFRETWQKMVHLLGNKDLSLPYFTIFAQYFSFGGVVTLLPLRMSASGLEAFHVGMSLAAFSLTFLLFQPFAGRISDKRGRLKPVLSGAGFAAISIIILPWMSSFGLIIISMALYGTGFALLFPSTSAIIADRVPAKEYGQATGLFHSLITLGVSIGAPVMGWLAVALGTNAGLALSALLLVVSLALGIKRLPGFIR